MDAERDSEAADRWFNSINSENESSGAGSAPAKRLGRMGS